MKHLLILAIFCTSLLIAQVRELSGKIIDDKGNPIYLANIAIEKTGIGTTSDIAGEFVLNVEFDEGDNLIISYIGYKSIRRPVRELSFDRSNTFFLNKLSFTSQTVLVKGSLGKEGVSPISFSKVDQKEIDESYVQQDIPEFLSYLPSTTFYSEGGNGIGYNYISIRGFDQRRISISINGIPQNDPEDHNVYWLDFPDLLSSVGMIQVQRGAGSGVIGYPAIGGSINILTSNFSDKPFFELGANYGTFNTQKYSASFASGLIKDKYSVYVKLSKTLSDGYRDLSWADFNSYYVSAVRYDKSVTTQLNFYGGPIADGLVYTGLPKFTIKDRDLRKENYSYWEASENEYTYKLARKETEIENFSQPHFELLNDIKISNNVTLNSSIFLVLGDGFFDYDGSWSVYYDDYFRLGENGYDSTQIPTNALIRATVKNSQWGWIPRININHTNGNLILGGEFRFHRSDHYGNINYAENIPSDVPGDYEYYFYNGLKDIISFYAHENFQFSSKFNMLAELQLAYHKYRLYNEKYVGTDFTIDGLFLNPRIGLNYLINTDWNLFFSFAQVTREPRLKNYYDAAESSGGEVPQFETDANGNYDFSKPLVIPETMNSFELGTGYNTRYLSLSANVFYMLFSDEIVKNGQVDRFGQPITGNMDKTVHTGIEFSGTIKLTNNFDFTLTGSYSKNTIEQGSYFIDDNNSINLKGNKISGFPDLTLNGIIRFTSGGFYSQLWLKYVGEYFTDNYDNNLEKYLIQYPGLTDYSDNRLNSYFVSNILFSYQFKTEPTFKSIKVFLQVNNILDNLYAAYGIGKEFFPAAERNFVAGVKIGL